MLHINPAVTFGFAVETGQFAKFAPYVVSRTGRSVRGSDSHVAALFCPIGRKRKTKTSSWLCFCTMPAIRNLIANLISEIIGTFLLVFVVGAIFF